MIVCIGGTFNILHKGHKILISKAFEKAGKTGKVFIGVTKGEILQNKIYVKPYNERVNAIKKYLLKQGYDKQAIIKPILDKYGPTIDGEFDAIIVSPETIKNAEEINKKRIANRKNPLEIIKIPFVLAEDKKPISSTRILKKEIDNNGKIFH